MSDAATPPGDAHGPGPLAWMVNNRVTPNLLMLVFMVGGFLMSLRIKKEVFPEFDLDLVTIGVAYPGASPEEVEQGIVLAIEEVVRGLDGVEEVTATASEGFGSVNVELIDGTDSQRVYQDIKQEIDRITTFPEESEEPSVSLAGRRRGVIDLQLYGEVDEWSLRNLAEETRDRLLQNPGITQVELTGARDFEIHVEITQENLRAYDLTLAEVAQAIATSALELPGGSLKTESGEILVRLSERRDWAAEFASVPVKTIAEGTQVRLGDIANIRDGFEESDRFARFDGKNSIGLSISRIGDQTPVGVATAVRTTMDQVLPDLPPGIEYSISDDRSQIYEQRLRLLLKNACLGLVLVLLVLGLFLEIKLAFWVTMGIPISFLGAMLFLPATAVTINMISMFAFIITLGIVVDDAIVAGENIYEYRQLGMSNFDAAIRGARDVAMPIGFSIITNVIAFLPLMFVPGFIGKIWRTIPVVVIAVFLISWLESLFILPSHLAHTSSRPRSWFTAQLHRRQQAFARRLDVFIDRIYRPFLEWCLHWRGVTIATALAILAGILAYVASGRIGLIAMPRVESDVAVVTAVLPVGSPVARSMAVSDRLVGAVEQVAGEVGREDLVTGVFAVVNGNRVEVRAYLTDPKVRPLSTTDLVGRWREAVGPVAGVDYLLFESDRGGPGSGASLTVELSHRDIEVLDQASAALADTLTEFPNVKDVDDGYSPGKQQYDFVMKPEGRSLGLTGAAVARQVRAAFYGAEALRQQRGRNEIKVMVRLPEAERTSPHDIDTLLIRTPAGTDVPLREVATITRGRSYTTINRRDGRRTVTVRANVDPIGETSQVQATLVDSVLPQLVRDYPGLSFGFQGRQADFSESMGALMAGFKLALLAIYFMLAIPFRSYTQPLIVMVSIPFGVVGAVLGHLIMGYNLSIISMMGIIALSGVVVNDSLILIDYANRRRREGQGGYESIISAGTRRFRPILLTTITTFGGLAPMIFETSRQARFMIPMAISLGFGILFATAISLVIVPCLYLLLEDAKTLLARRFAPAAPG